MCGLLRGILLHGMFACWGRVYAPRESDNLELEWIEDIGRMVPVITVESG